METIFEKLDASLNGDPILIAGPAATGWIEDIEAFARFTIPATYREFLKRYGAAIVGPYPIFGCGASEAMSQLDASVIDVTRRFRTDRWPGTQAALVISVDHAGNAITINADGTVQRFDHDEGKSEIVAGDFVEFVEWCLEKT